MPSATAHLHPTKKTRQVNPIGMRVLVRLRKEPSQNDAGLYLPEGAKDATKESMLAEVIEVASATDTDTDEEANISGIPQGALVILAKNAGIKVPWDDDLRIVDTKEVLAIVHEIDLS